LMVPVRCFTCGNLIGDKWEEFAERVKNGEKPGKVLDDLAVTRYCCRRMILSNVEIIDEVLKYHHKESDTSKTTGSGGNDAGSEV